MSLNLPDPNQPLPHQPALPQAGPMPSSPAAPEPRAATPPSFPDGSRGAPYRKPYAVKRRNGFVIALLVSGPILFVVIIGLTLLWTSAQYR